MKLIRTFCGGVLLVLLVTFVPAVGADGGETVQDESETKSSMGFKGESSFVVDYRKIGLVTTFLLIGVGAALYTMKKYGYGVNASLLNPNAKVIEKIIISPGLVGFVIEIDRNRFLIIQDKQSHSVTRLNLEDVNAN